MSEGRCPFALWLPGPEWKTGYDGRDKTHMKAGLTIHTAEYDLAQDDKILYNALFSGRIASWHFTITKEGFCFQHYLPEAVAWHCGHPGNLWTVGIEMEGIAPDKISGPQYDVLVRLLRWLGVELGWSNAWRRTLGKTVAVGGNSIYEHRDWMPTDCAVFSRGMIDLYRLIADLKEEQMANTPEQWAAGLVELKRDFAAIEAAWPMSDEEKRDPQREEAERRAWQHFYDAQYIAMGRKAWINR